jgi:tetraacyldisaccharide 4'-kinase
MILEPKFWKKSNSIISKLLLPFSYLYLFLRWIAQLISCPYISQKFIICVGNITIGGNGKTPTVCFLASYFQALGLKVVIASRGYKGQEKSIKKVMLNDNPILVGDEALILAKFAPCYIGKDKKKLISTIEIIENPEIIIMDDGLQSFSIKKDFEILVIDGLRGFGNNKIIPAGPLREKVYSRLNTVNHIIFIGDDLTGIKSSLKENAQITQGWLKPLNPQSDITLNYIAFSGIGNPEKFFLTLRDSNYNLIQTIAYPDHYYYRPKDLEYLDNLSRVNNTKLITTVKDAVKLPVDFREKIEILDIGLALDNTDFLTKLAKKL